LLNVFGNVLEGLARRYIVNDNETFVTVYVLQKFNDSNAKIQKKIQLKKLLKNH